jgi:outer membrane lipoprotein carrier protein
MLLGIHGLRRRNVNFHVRRFALMVSLAVLPGLAAERDMSGMLRTVEKRYNAARTVQVLFQQSYTVQGGRARSERGELFLLKPGRMRWQYQSPAGKLFLSDGKYVYLYSPDSNRVEKMNLRESEDMRAPLAFLLGKLNFHKDFHDLVFSPEGSDTRVTASPKSGQLPYTKVEFIVTPLHEIRYLQVTGQDNSLMQFTFEDEKLNPPLPASLFRFRTPPGAEVVDTADTDRGAH